MNGEPVGNAAISAIRKVSQWPTWHSGSGLFAEADARVVNTRWVRGHSGDPYNERADALANKALRLRSGSPP